MHTRKLTDVEKELVRKLRKIWNDKEFVVCVLAHLESDDECKEVIEFIDSNDNVKSEDVVLLSLNIDRSRGNITVNDIFKNS